MHSRIFQIEPEPVEKDDYINTNILPDWFTYSIADYTDDSPDRAEDIEWLMIHIGDIATRDKDKLTFSSNVRRYFKDSYESFIKAAKKLTEVSFDNFVSTCGVSNTFTHLKDSYSDEYGFYVYSEGLLSTLDDFMRTVKDGETYYFGGTLDYHF